ncbi:hypothetical protein ACVR0S_08215 [Streptococcus dentapri]|uniref:Bacteriocin n=1 Tax=Streptococcus dentapri TaxID=573564 RepID=A0ABV8D3B7_9STRE
MIETKNYIDLTTEELSDLIGGGFFYSAGQVIGWAVKVAATTVA